jgi:hypothetical protein
VQQLVGDSFFFDDVFDALRDVEYDVNRAAKLLRGDSEPEPAAHASQTAEAPVSAIAENTQNATSANTNVSRFPSSLAVALCAPRKVMPVLSVDIPPLITREATSMISGASPDDTVLAARNKPITQQHHKPASKDKQ